jgi:hypothetical protein
MTNTLYRTAALGSIFALSVVLFAVHGSAQSPPTATEAFNLRIKCKKMSDEKAQEFIDGNTSMKLEIVAARNTSKYDPISNRCYGRFYGHTKNANLYDIETDQVYDLQTDDLLANAEIKNGKKHGSIWDPDYKKPFGPSCVGGCPANFGDQTWQATEDYMNELMADPRKQ